nr:MAG TPA: hypothetical protein [Caudoviricetes sp.]
MSKCLQKLRGSSPEQNTRLQLLHSDTHVVFRRLSVVSAGINTGQPVTK